MQGRIAFLLARRGGCALALHGGGIAQWHPDPEHAAVPELRAQAHLVPQQPAQPLDDGQAQAGAAVALVVAFVQAAEFLEDLALQRLGDAGALVVDLDAHMARLMAAADHDAPAPAVADGVGHEVLHDAAQQVLVGANNGARRHAAQLQAPAVGEHAEIVAQHLQQRPERHVADAHFELPGLHAGDVQQAAQDRVLRGEGAVDAVGRMLGRVAVQVAAQQRGEHAGRVERLQQVVHRGGDEAALVAVGALGFMARGFQVARAFAHPLLQRIGQGAQLARRVLVAGDVGIAGDEAAVRQRVAADLQHRAVALGAFVQVRLAAAQVLQAPGDGLFGRGRPQQAAPGVVAQQGLDGLADRHQVGRVAKELHVARIPRHQPQLRVDDDHALRQVLQAARQTHVGLLGRLLGRLHDAVLGRAQLLRMLLEHGFQLLAAVLAQPRHALALAHEEHQQAQRQPAATAGGRGPAAVGHAAVRVVYQVQLPGGARQGLGMPEHLPRQRRGLHAGQHAAVVQSLFGAVAQRPERLV